MQSLTNSKYTYMIVAATKLACGATLTLLITFPASSTGAWRPTGINRSSKVQFFQLRKFGSFMAIAFPT